MTTRVLILSKPLHVPVFENSSGKFTFLGLRRRIIIIFILNKLFILSVVFIELKAI